MCEWSAAIARQIPSAPWRPRWKGLVREAAAQDGATAMRAHFPVALRSIDGMAFGFPGIPARTTPVGLQLSAHIHDATLRAANHGILRQVGAGMTCRTLTQWHIQHWCTASQAPRGIKIKVVQSKAANKGACIVMVLLHLHRPRVEPSPEFHGDHARVLRRAVQQPRAACSHKSHPAMTAARPWAPSSFATTLSRRVELLEPSSSSFAGAGLERVSAYFLGE